MLPDASVQLELEHGVKTAYEYISSSPGLVFESQKNGSGKGLPQLRLTNFFFAFSLGTGKIKEMLWVGIAMFAFAY